MLVQSSAVDDPCRDGTLGQRGERLIIIIGVRVDNYVHAGGLIPYIVEIIPIVVGHAADYDVTIIARDRPQCMSARDRVRAGVANWRARMDVMSDNWVSPGHGVWAGIASRSGAGRGGHMSRPQVSIGRAFMIGRCGRIWAGRLDAVLAIVHVIVGGIRTTAVRVVPDLLAVIHVMVAHVLPCVVRPVTRIGVSDRATVVRVAATMVSSGLPMQLVKK